MYADGANNEFGSEHTIANGVPTVIVPGNNKNGKDDYSLVVCYTYTNGYGEVGALTTGFSNNQTFLAGNSGIVSNVKQETCNHIYNITTTASCNKDGLKIYTCQLCGYTYSEHVSAYHEWSSTNFSCTICGKEAESYNFNIFDYDSKMGTSLSTSQYVEIPQSFEYNGNQYKITSIASNGFKDCSSLIKITIPTSIKTIGSFAFDGCVSLKYVDFFEGSQLETVERAAFSTWTGTACISLETITFPEGLKTIGYDCFRQCTSLRTVILLDSVELIGAQAFSNCSSLTTINIPKGITTLNDHTFNECSNLTTITIPNNVTEIKNSVFRECVNLKNIIIPDTVISFGTSVFHKCTSLELICLPSNITIINGGDIWYDGMFKSCSSLKSITIPRYVKEIKGYAFADCANLETIIFEGTRDEWNNIVVGNYWNDSVPATYVQCTDGQVTL